MRASSDSTEPIGGLGSGAIAFEPQTALERELSLAMTEFARSTPAPHYDPLAFLPATRRRPRSWVLAACAVLVAGTVATVAALLGGGQPHGGRPAPMVAPWPSKSASASPSPFPLNNPHVWKRLNLQALFTAAEQQEHAGLRGRVSLPAVAALFTDRAAYQRAWGSGGLGITCGQTVDGAFSNLEQQILLYRGTTRLSDWVSVDFDPNTSLIADVHCNTHGAPPGDGTLTDYLGHLVQGQQQSADMLLAQGVRGVRRGAGQTSCLAVRPTVWFVDDPGGGLVRARVAWKVVLDGGRPYLIGDDGKGQIAEVDCPSSTIGQ